MGKSKKQGGKKYNRRSIKNKKVFTGAGLLKTNSDSITGNLSSERKNILLGNLYLLSLGLLDVSALTDSKHKSMEDIYNKNKDEDKKVFDRLGWKSIENLPGYVASESTPTAAPDASEPEEEKDEKEEKEEEEEKKEKEKVDG